MESDLAARVAQLRAMIEQHPWQIVGAAALFGAWLAFEPPRVRVREPSVVLSIIGAVALRFAREAAFRHAAELAKRWWDVRSAAIASSVG